MCDDVLCPDDTPISKDDGCSGCLTQLLLYFPLYTILGFLLATFYVIIMLPKNPSDAPLFISIIHMIVILSLAGLYFTRHIYAWLWEQISKLIDEKAK